VLIHKLKLLHLHDQWRAITIFAVFYPTFSRLFRSRNNISEKLRRETAKLDPAYL